jgi:hypothetical protein
LRRGASSRTVWLPRLSVIHIGSSTQIDSEADISGKIRKKLT